MENISKYAYFSLSWIRNPRPNKMYLVSKILSRLNNIFIKREKYIDLL